MSHFLILALKSTKLEHGQLLHITFQVIKSQPVYSQFVETCFGEQIPELQ